MTKTFIKTGLISMFLAILVVSTAGSALAQTTTVMAPSPTVAPICPSIGINLRLGATDAQTGGYVSYLQDYLSTQGYFNSAYMGSGRFGPVTLAAVARFQAANGLPATGYVGPMTRNAIAVRCGIVVPPKQPVSINYLSPQSGKVGTTVVVSGNGFNESNTIWMDGSIIATNVPVQPQMMRPCYVGSDCSSLQTLVFTIPDSISPYCAPGMMCAMYMRQVTPGTYKISVSNAYGNSNTVPFTVTSSQSSGTVSITGIDAPVSMTIGQPGTWTVHASIPDTNASVRYSVVWGDENIGLYERSSIMAPLPSTIQTSATFSHIYLRTGTYSPTFTITDDMGRTTQVTTQVTVTPVY